MLMRRIYSLIAFLLMTFAATAQSVVTLDFANNVFGISATESADPLTKEFGGVTMTATKGGNSTLPRLDKNLFRFYQNSLLNLSVNGTITSVQFAVASATYKTTDITQGGTALTGDTWTGSAAGSIEFSCAKQVRLASITVTYTPNATTVATPTFSLAEGTYNTAQSVTISATAGDNIFYTLDGSVPSETSNPYNGAISLATEGVYTLKAIAVNTAGEKSAVATARYTIDLPGVRDTLLSAKFQTVGNLEGFATEITSQDSAFNVWAVTQYGLTATGYVGGKAHDAEGWAITPKLDLTNKTNVVLSFDEWANYFTSEDTLKLQTGVFVRVNGGAWEELTLATRTGNNKTWKSTGDISLDKYKGQANVEVGFKYVSTTIKAGTWEVKNLVVLADVDTTTGISTATVAEPTVNAIYDLSGRRVQKAERGIYIINGKKTLVK